MFVIVLFNFFSDNVAFAIIALAILSPQFLFSEQHIRVCTYISRVKLQSFYNNLTVICIILLHKRARIVYNLHNL